MIEPIKVCELDGRKAEPPGPEVPDDRRDQHGEDHGEARLRADLQDQFHGQQRDDAKATAPVEVKTPRKLKNPDQTTATSGISEWV